MSRTQYVEYADRGFWAYDVAMGVFLKYLIDAAEASDQAKTTWLSTEISSWRKVSCISDYGLTLDPGWSAAQRRTFIVLAKEASASLAKRESIPAEEIAAWRLPDGLHIFPRGATEVLTAPVVELGHAIIALVSGGLPEPPEGKAWLYGAPTGRRML